MITKTLRTTSGKFKVQIPENLKEVTLGQMIEALKFDEENYDVHPLVPQLTREIADNVIDINDRYYIRERLLSLMHQVKYCYNGAELPELVYFGQKKIPVIKHLSMEPAGAYLASRNIIADEINKHIALYGEDNWQENFNPDLDAMAMILAHYFYFRVTGLPYKEKLAEEFKPKILRLPLQTALPIARYFFLAYPNLSKQKIKLWQLFRQKLRDARALRRLRNSGIST